MQRCLDVFNEQPMMPPTAFFLLTSAFFLLTSSSLSLTPTLSLSLSPLFLSLLVTEVACQDQYYAGVLVACWLFANLVVALCACASACKLRLCRTMPPWQPAVLQAFDFANRLIIVTTKVVRVSVKACFWLNELEALDEIRSFES